MSKPTLYIMSGLPGVGKTTLSTKLATHLGAVYIRIDTVEQALKDLCDFNVEGEGYRLSYRLAKDNLSIGLSVVADSCNPIELTRREWAAIATSSNAACRNIEIVCSDQKEHQRRIEHRLNAHTHHELLQHDSSHTNQSLPTWYDVINREYDDWDVSSLSRLRIDTFEKSIEQAFDELLAGLGD